MPRRRQRFGGLVIVRGGHLGQELKCYPTFRESSSRHQYGSSESSGLTNLFGQRELGMKWPYRLVATH
jgi:hypothetical protein